MSALTALLLIYGLAVGVSLGLTGGGGSIITVPLLVYAVGEPVHQAIATSLVVVGGIALLGFFGRIRQSDPVAGLELGLFGLLGAVPGRIVAQFFSGRTLLLMFAIIMVVASIGMLRSKTYESAPQKHRNIALVGVFGTAVGFLTGFLGVGGGFLIVPVLVLLLGVPIRIAIPTSLLVIGINCMAGLVGPALLAHGHIASIDYRVAFTFLIGGVGGTLIGAAIVRRLDALALKRIFAIFTLCIGLFVAASAGGLIPLSIK